MTIEERAKVNLQYERGLEINGNKEAYSIIMGDICFVLSIPLRDMFLAEHPEVPTEE